MNRSIGRVCVIRFCSDRWHILYTPCGAGGRGAGNRGAFKAGVTHKDEFSRHGHVSDPYLGSHVVHTREGLFMQDAQVDEMAELAAGKQRRDKKSDRHRARQMASTKRLFQNTRGVGGIGYVGATAHSRFAGSQFVTYKNKTRTATAGKAL